MAARLWPVTRRIYFDTTSRYVLIHLFNYSNCSFIHLFGHHRDRRLFLPFAMRILRVRSKAAGYFRMAVWFQVIPSGYSCSDWCLHCLYLHCHICHNISDRFFVFAHCFVEIFSGMLGAMLGLKTCLSSVVFTETQEALGLLRRWLQGGSHGTKMNQVQTAKSQRICLPWRIMTSWWLWICKRKIFAEGELALQTQTTPVPKEW